MNLYYEDNGTGDPVLLVHAWPLISKCWKKQAEALLVAGNRVITYDRRGFGRSFKPASGYDYHSLSLDLHRLIEHLDLKKLTLVGFSMGGGEVARYLSDYGSKRIARAVFIASVPPRLLKSPTNISGIDETALDKMEKNLVNERETFLREHLKNFYNQETLPVNDENLKYALTALPEALVGCIRAWRTDLSQEFSRIDIPTLIIHGDADRLLPATTGTLLHESIRTSRLVIIEGGSHGLNWTHADRLNAELLAFINSA
jgi:non-heme chloroperoxidase